MAALTTCIRRHRAALDAAGVDVEALKGRLAELRTVDGLEPRVAAMTAVEEFLDEAEGARAGTVAEIERQGGRAPAFEYRRGVAPTAEAGAPTEPVEGVPRPAEAAPAEQGRWQVKRESQGTTANHRNVRATVTAPDGRETFVIVSYPKEEQLSAGEIKKRAIARAQERLGPQPPQAQTPPVVPAEPAAATIPAQDEGAPALAEARERDVGVVDVARAGAARDVPAPAGGRQSLTADTRRAVQAAGTAGAGSATGLLRGRALPEPGASVSPTRAQAGFGTPKPPAAPSEPIGRARIIRNLERDLGVGIFQGRMKGKRSHLGFYKARNQEVRTREFGDLEVTAHEIGHFLDDAHKQLQALIVRHGAELTNVSDYSRSQKAPAVQRSEGFAEFMRLFLTQEPLAMEVAPAFYADFVEWVRADPKLTRALEQAQLDMHGWYQQGALNRALSRIGHERVPLRERVREETEGAWDRATQQTLDHLLGVRRMEEALASENRDPSAYATSEGREALLGVARTVEDVKALARENRAAARQMRNDPDLSGEEKASIDRALRAERTEIFKRASEFLSRQQIEQMRRELAAETAKTP